MAASTSEEGLNFDYRELRLMVGILAFSLPWVVVLIALALPPSISASYHTKARDVFVGSIFVIGALLIAYKGHSKHEEWVSTFGGVAAIITALFPTACNAALFPSFCPTQLAPTLCASCGSALNSNIHGVAAAVLFGIIVYFCLVVFLRRVISKLEGNSDFNISLVTKYVLNKTGNNSPQSKKKILRVRIYVFCGILMALVLVYSVIVSGINKASYITFWAEMVAMILFGVAWMTASKFWFFGDDEEKNATKL
jgi:hypothetical protein